MADLSVAVWGGATWRTIHAFALGYDLRRHAKAAAAAASQGISVPQQETERTAVLAFMRSLESLLPCSACRNSFAGLMSRRGVQTSLEEAARDGEVFAWTVGMHNATNAHLNRPADMTVEGARHALLTSARDGSTPIPWAAACVGGTVALAALIGVSTFLWRHKHMRARV